MQDTLHLAINLLDRMVSLAPVGVINRRNYQLLGTTCLWISAKYEENHGRVPSLDALSYNCCNSYKKKDFVIMENNILRELEFRLGSPSCESFLRLHLKMYFSPQTPQIVHLSRYIVDQTLVDHRFVGIPYSLISYSSILLSQRICGLPRVTITDNRIDKCMKLMCDSLYSCPEQLIRKVIGNLFTIVFKSCILQDFTTYSS